MWAADGAFCKPGSGFPGQLLNLTGVDSQGSPVTVGYALVMSENADAYRWFFEHASTIKLDDDRTFGDVLNSGDSVMFSDRQKGLRSAVQLVFPDCHHLLCCHHLLVFTNVPGRECWFGLPKLTRSICPHRTIAAKTSKS